MASHKFHVGEIVNLRPVVSRNVPGGAYEVTKQCLTMGGDPQAMALGTSHRLRVTDAALVNGIACHALDFDDTHVPTILHPTTPLYAAGTPLAEWRGAGGVGLPRFGALQRFEPLQLGELGQLFVFFILDVRRRDAVLLPVPAEQCHGP